MDRARLKIKESDDDDDEKLRMELQAMEAWGRNMTVKLKGCNPSPTILRPGTANLGWRLKRPKVWSLT